MRCFQAGEDREIEDTNHNCLEIFVLRGKVNDDLAVLFLVLSGILLELNVLPSKLSNLVL